MTSNVGGSGSKTIEIHGGLKFLFGGVEEKGGGGREGGGFAKKEKGEKEDKTRKKKREKNKQINGNKVGKTSQHEKAAPKEKTIGQKD